MAVDELRLGDPIEQPLGQGTVLGDGLDFEQTAIGIEADGPQRGQVGEATSDSEIVGVVDRGLGAQGAPFLEVLLDLGGFVADVQRRDDPLGDDAGVERARRAFANPPLEDQADLGRSPQIEVFADDRLEQVTPGQGPVEHLGAGELRLQDGQLWD